LDGERPGDALRELTASVVKVALQKGDPAWLVDWPATRAQ
jgi:hypothetical protein